MPISVSMTVAQLKALFESGDKPTGADFANLIESTYGRDQILQFNPVSGDLGISTSDGAPYNIVNIADMLDANLSFVYSNSTRKLTITRNGNAIVLGPFDGPWTVATTGNKAHTTRWIGIGNSNPGYPLHVTGNAKIEGKTTVTGDLFADKDLQIQDQLRFGGHGEYVERITDVVSTASSSAHALTTENAVIDFVRKHSTQPVLLVQVDTSVLPYSAGSNIVPFAAYIDGYNHAGSAFSGSTYTVPTGMGGYFLAQVNLTHNGISKDIRTIVLRRLHSGGNIDFVLDRHDLDPAIGTTSVQIEVALQAGDSLQLIFSTTKGSATLSGFYGLKRLPDAIL